MRKGDPGTTGPVDGPDREETIEKTTDVGRKFLPGHVLTNSHLIVKILMKQAFTQLYK